MIKKVQFFKAVESCTGGYGQFRCQWVKEDLLSGKNKTDR